jgi:hypothetical protein
MEVLLMTDFVMLVIAAIAAMLGVLEKLLGAHEAYLELRRSDKEQASLPKAHDRNRT